MHLDPVIPILCLVATVATLSPMWIAVFRRFGAVRPGAAGSPSPG